MTLQRNRKLAGAALLTLGFGLAGCAGMPTNASLYSDKQPVIERTNFTLDLNTSPSGLAIAEQQRLNGWFETMDLGYGDRIAIEDPSNNPAVSTAVNALANRYGLIVSEVAPTTEGFLEPGQARVVITRSSASVPDCPDWSAQSDSNYFNGISPNYGCSTNSNFAAMIADPEDLLAGKDTEGETVVATGTKAIDAYRELAPTGSAGLQGGEGGEN
ncbi:MAG: CpaD family pilus assembly protein [Erythrobacter sp.]|jgi:pilus assembly protein CpaD|nr:CpaD family pilus assembly protein [Erythrobacter sp.]